MRQNNLKLARQLGLPSPFRTQRDRTLPPRKPWQPGSTASISGFQYFKVRSFGVWNFSRQSEKSGYFELFTFRNLHSSNERTCIHTMARLSDYDCIGFDLDHTLIQYKLDNLYPVSDNMASKKARGFFGFSRVFHIAFFYYYTLKGCVVTSPK